MREKQPIPEETKSPFFTILLIVSSRSYLVDMTMQSILSQSERDFEIVIMEHGLLEKDLKMLREISSKISRVLSSFVASPVKMKNRALSFAKGKYVQFMEPGNTFLSPRSLEIVKKRIEEEREPEYIYSAYLSREERRHPTVYFRPFSRDLLLKGHIPCRLEAMWFSRDLFQKPFLFDKRYEKRETFDLLCHMIAEKEIRRSQIKMVLTDYTPEKKIARDIFLYEWETLLILFRNFGFFNALCWCFFEDHLQCLRLRLSSFQQAFMKGGRT